MSCAGCASGVGCQSKTGGACAAPGFSANGTFGTYLLGDIPPSTGARPRVAPRTGCKTCGGKKKTPASLKPRFTGPLVEGRLVRTGQLGDSLGGLSDIVTARLAESKRLLQIARQRIASIDNLVRRGVSLNQRHAYADEHLQRARTYEASSPQAAAELQAAAARIVSATPYISKLGKVRTSERGTGPIETPPSSAPPEVPPAAPAPAPAAWPASMVCVGGCVFYNPDDLSVMWDIPAGDRVTAWPTDEEGRATHNPPADYDPSWIGKGKLLVRRLETGDLGWMDPPQLTTGRVLGPTTGQTGPRGPTGPASPPANSAAADKAIRGGQDFLIVLNLLEQLSARLRAEGRSTIPADVIAAYVRAGKAGSAGPDAERSLIKLIQGSKPYEAIRQRYDRYRRALGQQLASLQAIYQRAGRQFPFLPAPGGLGTTLNPHQTGGPRTGVDLITPYAPSPARGGRKVSVSSAPTPPPSGTIALRDVLEAIRKGQPYKMIVGLYQRYQNAVGVTNAPPIESLFNQAGRPLPSTGHVNRGFAPRQLVPTDPAEYYAPCAELYPVDPPASASQAFRDLQDAIASGQPDGLVCSLSHRFTRKRIEALTVNGILARLDAVRAQGPLRAAVWVGWTSNERVRAADRGPGEAGAESEAEASRIPGAIRTALDSVNAPRPLSIAGYIEIVDPIWSAAAYEAADFALRTAQPGARPGGGGAVVGLGIEGDAEPMVIFYPRAVARPQGPPQGQGERLTCVAGLDECVFYQSLTVDSPGYILPPGTAIRAANDPDRVVEEGWTAVVVTGPTGDVVPGYMRSDVLAPANNERVREADRAPREARGESEALVSYRSS